MSLYTIKKGKFYSKGNKMQPLYMQYGLLILGIVLGITLDSWWYILGGLMAFICINSLALSETASDTRKVYFSPSCAYKRLPTNYDQVNKLYGFSEGHHQKNSARIGWRCTDGVNIELVAYAYVDGVNIRKPMIKVPTETWVLCNIQNQANKYVFKAISLKNQSVTITIEKGKKTLLSRFLKLFMYRLFPYFGGKIPAPNDMSLQLIK